MSLEIPEITPIEIKKSDVKDVRINLLVPGVSERAMFGGVSTAIDIFLQLAADFNNIRIVVTDERIESGVHSARLKDFVPESLENDANGKFIVWAGDRYGKNMPVRCNDVFICTAWWTAYTGFKIIDLQNNWFGENSRKLIYVIQDYEPNFYAWSSRFSLAQSTYAQEKDTIAIINSSLLANYLRAKGHKFNLGCVFEPKLNSSLKLFYDQNKENKKERLLFVYGRPGVQRNAFEIVIQALRAWASSGDAAKQGWRVVSAGEDHENIALGGDLELVSLGKLSLTEYADLLSRTAIGLSLMISPHPSYPPLELAAFGAGVVTNTFEFKNLSALHPSIFSVDYPEPSKLAEAIAWKCYEFENNREINWSRRESFSWPYLDTKSESGVLDAVRHYLRTNYSAKLD